MSVTGRPPIVVTDNHPELLELVRELLVDSGYGPVICTTSAQFGDVVTRQCPRLAMIDISLSRPEVGWSLLDRLRLYPPTADVPVILTATNTKSLAAKVQHLTRLNCSVLEKPFKLADLLLLVERIIGPPELRGRTV